MPIGQYGQKFAKIAILQTLGSRPFLHGSVSLVPDHREASCLRLANPHLPCASAAKVGKRQPHKLPMPRQGRAAAPPTGKRFNGGCPEIQQRRMKLETKTERPNAGTPGPQQCQIGSVMEAPLPREHAGSNVPPPQRGAPKRVSREKQLGGNVWQVQTGWGAQWSVLID